MSKDPWLEPNDPKRKMTDQWIIENTVTFNQSSLSKEEQEDVYNLVVMYRGVFSLRGKIGTCSNIETDLQVIDKCPFFTRTLHVREKKNHW